MADLSIIQRVGDLKIASRSVYLANASFATVRIIGKNLPINPSYIKLFSVILVSIAVYYSTSASLPPVI